MKRSIIIEFNGKSRQKHDKNLPTEWKFLQQKKTGPEYSWNPKDLDCENQSHESRLKTNYLIKVVWDGSGLSVP